MSNVDLNRRTLLMGAAASIAALNAPRVAAARKAPKAFVLVHGTWHGGWAWSAVAEQLRDAGHHVITPTCTGCGERHHLTGPEVNLSTHVRDIVEAVKFAEIDKFVLVGHSFSGLTITGVADALPDHIERLIYFDALVPTAKRRAAVMPDPETGAWPLWWQKRVLKFRGGYDMRFWDSYSLDMLVPPDAVAARERLTRLLTGHPAGQWTEQLVLENGGWEPHRRDYVHCVGQAFRPSSEAMYGPALGEGWGFHQFDAPRDAMLTDPEKTTKLLLDLAHA